MILNVYRVTWYHKTREIRIVVAASVHDALADTEGVFPAKGEIEGIELLYKGAYVMNPKIKEDAK